MACEATEELPELSIRIGVHTGLGPHGQAVPAACLRSSLVGNIGSETMLAQGFKLLNKPQERALPWAPRKMRYGCLRLSRSTAGSCWRSQGLGDAKQVAMKLEDWSTAAWRLAVDRISASTMALTSSAGGLGHRNRHEIGLPREVPRPRGT